MNIDLLSLIGGKKINKIMHYVRFNICYKVQILDLILMILLVIINLTGLCYANKFTSYIIYFLIRAFVLSFLSVYIYLGYYKFGNIMNNFDFNKNLSYAIILRLFYPLLFFGWNNLIKFFGIVVSLIIMFFLFRAFDYIKENIHTETAKLSKYYRYSFIALTISLIGHLLTFSLYNIGLDSIGTVISTIGWVAQTIFCLIIIYWNLRLFKNLGLKYDTNLLPNVKKL